MVEMTEVVHYDGHHHYTLHVFKDGIQDHHATVVTHHPDTGVEETEYYADVNHAKAVFNTYTGEQVW